MAFSGDTKYDAQPQTAALATTAASPTPPDDTKSNTPVSIYYTATEVANLLEKALGNAKLDPSQKKAISESMQQTLHAAQSKQDDKSQTTATATATDFKIVPAEFKVYTLTELMTLFLNEVPQNATLSEEAKYQREIIRNLLVCHFDGIKNGDISVAEKDLQSANKIIQQLQNQYDPKKCMSYAEEFLLAIAYSYGTFVNKLGHTFYYYDEAMAIFLKLHRNDYPLASTMLANDSRHDLYTKAEFLRAAKHQGCSYALFCSGKNTESAKLGCPRALYAMGEYQKAARLGYVIAMGEVALRVTKKNLNNSEQYYLAAINAGLSISLFLKNYPGTKTQLAFIGITLAEQGHLEKASKIFAILKPDELSPNENFRIGQHYMLTKQDDLAFDHLREAVLSEHMEAIKLLWNMVTHLYPDFFTQQIDLNDNLPVCILSLQKGNSTLKAFALCIMNFIDRYPIETSVETSTDQPDLTKPLMQAVADTVIHPRMDTKDAKQPLNQDPATLSLTELANAFIHEATENTLPKPAMIHRQAIRHFLFLKITKIMSVAEQTDFIAFITRLKANKTHNVAELILLSKVAQLGIGCKKNNRQYYSLTFAAHQKGYSLATAIWGRIQLQCNFLREGRTNYNKAASQGCPTAHLYLAESHSTTNLETRLLHFTKAITLAHSIAAIDGLIALKRLPHNNHDEKLIHTTLATVGLTIATENPILANTCLAELNPRHLSPDQNLAIGKQLFKREPTAAFRHLCEAMRNQDAVTMKTLCVLLKDQIPLLDAETHYLLCPIPLIDGTITTLQQYTTKLSQLVNQAPAPIPQPARNGELLATHARLLNGAPAAAEVLAPASAAPNQGQLVNVLLQSILKKG